MPDKIDFDSLLAANTAAYYNVIVSAVNDHVVRLSMMTEPYPWHVHPNSDETFIGVKGVVLIETPDALLELSPGSCITIPRNTAHRTSPKDGQSVNLTIEAADMATTFVDDKPFISKPTIRAVPGIDIP